MPAFTAISRSNPNPGGRPSSFSPEKLRAICAYIRHLGLSDLAAGEMAGVPRSTLSRWKSESEEVAMQLEAARAAYLIPRLRAIAETRLRDGRFDWRAQAWLVKFSDPEAHGRPSSRRRLCNFEVTEEIARPAAQEAALADLDLGLAGWRAYRPGGTITPPMARVREIYQQAGEEIPIGTGAAKSVAFPPETSAAEEWVAGGKMEGVANPPETAPLGDASLTHPTRRRTGIAAEGGWASQTTPPCEVELHSSVHSQVQPGNEGQFVAATCRPACEPRESVAIPPETPPCGDPSLTHSQPPL